MTAPPSPRPRDPDAPAAGGAGPADGTGTGDADATEPALALAGVWDLLDVLPPAAASPVLSATTLELAAVPSAGTVPPAGTASTAVLPAAHAPAPPGRRPAWLPAWLPTWLPPALVVIGGLGVGYAAGRSTAPDPDRRVLDHLPEIEHLDLLREAGSVSFLEEIAKAGYAPPRRLGIVQSPAEVMEDTREFDAAIDDLRKAAGAEPTAAMIEARRSRLLAMPDRERRQIEKAVESWLALSTADQRELARLARALAEPRRDALLKAARLWHQWVRQRDPADRRDVIDLGVAERIEWIDRATRFESRFDQRDQQRPPFDRDWENRRRYPGGAAAAGPGGGQLGQPGGPRGPGQQGGPGPGGFGGPRPRPPGAGPGGGPPGQEPGPRPGPGADGERRPPFSGRERPPERPDRQDAAETPPPPR